MEINKDIFAIDLALYLKKQNTLVISDTHIGFEESLNKQGVLVPRIEYDEMIKRLGKIIADVKKEFSVDKLSKIIINGDVKDEFGTISETEWRQMIRFFDFMLNESDEIILIKGNHDPILGPVAKKREVRVEKELLIDDVMMLHGNSLPKEKELFKKAKLLILGHEHPAISLEQGTRVETFKCFLLGEYKGKQIIVMPSFNTLTEGTNVLREKIISPFIKDVYGFKAYVVGEEVYDFGRIKDFVKKKEL
jgi:putative SbcD/Mre11-related phosphoesterase